jgi:hypothetical protein
MTSTFTETASSIFARNEYTIRRKVLKIFGASFQIYSGDRIVGFSQQKAFKLKEDIRVFSDETKSTEILTIQARQIVDFSAAYDIVDSAEEVKVGAARRKGMASLVRDSWELIDADDQPIAKLQEDSMGLALLRRFLTNLVPQSFHLSGGAAPVTFKQRFNPFVYRLDVRIPMSCELDHRLIMGAAVLICAIEGRQQ